MTVISGKEHTVIKTTSTLGNYNYNSIYENAWFEAFGSLPEMRIWSILLIKSDLKWCRHLSKSLFLYFNYLVSVPEGTCCQVLRSTPVDS